MTSIINGILFWNSYKTTIRDSRISLQNTIIKEANGIYGSIFSKVETLTAEYADVILDLPLDNEAQLARVSESTVGSLKQIAGGGYWLEYYIIKDKKYYGPYWYKDGAEIKLTWDYSNEQNDYTINDWYKNDGIESGKKIVWSDLYNDTVTNVAMITATSALVQDSKKIGVVTIDIGLADLTDYINTIEIPGLTTYSLSLLTGKGMCVTNKDTSLIGQHTLSSRFFHK